ncbi:nucleotidyltransferase domain-containing protein [Nocardioides currus]|uniref:Polymerase nucleotidyl transferase domain-containing protein n=1 Tax=Nocardioides currus TaxID=2133958 RepID=A0A2R7YWX2_9ACTN|nr:nucleotidyltransferase domain-containing protein [Nocardioides currus]PUA80897.1 hypothetical protein C7S10_10860 [Nocardioides currus]
MQSLPVSVAAFAERLDALGWVRSLWVGGSLATGDHVPGVSDLDLVAVVDGPVDASRTAVLIGLHRELDRGVADGADLGCVYVDEARLLSAPTRHPTWTHGVLVDRPLSGISRAELVLHGSAVLGRSPLDLLPPVSADDVRAAARAELAGYWTWAARRPYLWSDTSFVDLGLTSMARGRHALRTGTLLTKTAAIEVAHAPGWLIEDMRARRSGAVVGSPRLRAGWVGWRDAWMTTRSAEVPRA